MRALEGGGMINYKLRLIVFCMLVILIVVGINTIIDVTPSHVYDPTKEILLGIVVWLSPLVVVSVAVLIAPRKTIAFSAAFFSLLVGGVVEYLYYQSHDLSRVMFLAINLFAYWVAGFISFFSFLKVKP
jgi:hypothetical protein